MCNPDLSIFVEQFRNLWSLGYDAHLDAHTHAGEAWVNIRVRLGQAQINPTNYSSRNRSNNGPARQRRRSRRSAERAAKAANISSRDLDSTFTNAEKAFADENIIEPVKNINKSEIETTEKVETVVDEEKVVREDLEKHGTEEVEIVVDNEDIEKLDTEKVENVVTNDEENEKVTKEEDPTLDQEPVKDLAISSEVVVFATVVIEDSCKKVLEQADFIAIQELTFRENHLKENIKKLEFGQYSTKELRKGFKHSFQLIFTVGTANLWESPRGYIWKFFGRDEWKKKDGSRVTFNRIHSK